MTFAQRQNRLTTHFSERIPVVKRRISVQMRCKGRGAFEVRWTLRPIPYTTRISHKQNISPSLCSISVLLTSGMWRGIVWCLNVSAEHNSSIFKSILKIEEACSSEKSIAKYKPTRRYRPTGHYLRSASGYWKDNTSVVFAVRRRDGT
jgi:hypothetical protein